MGAFLGLAPAANEQLTSNATINLNFIDGRWPRVARSSK
jgi:hypothetical protein